MFADTVRTLFKAPLVARLSVVDDKGYPHTVPLWYDVDGDDIVMISDRATRKVGFIGANPRASICIGGGALACGEIGPGYLLKGLCSNEEDPGYAWLRRITLRYESGDNAEASIAEWQRELAWTIHEGA